MVEERKAWLAVVPGALVTCPVRSHWGLKAGVGAGRTSPVSGSQSRGRARGMSAVLPVGACSRRRCESLSEGQVSLCPGGRGGEPRSAGCSASEKEGAAWAPAGPARAHSSPVATAPPPLDWALLLTQQGTPRSGGDWPALPPGSSSSSNTTLPSTSAWSSIRASNYSVPLSSTAQSTSGEPGTGCSGGPSLHTVGSTAGALREPGPRTSSPRQRGRGGAFSLAFSFLKPDRPRFEPWLPIGPVSKCLTPDSQRVGIRE